MPYVQTFWWRQVTRPKKIACDDNLKKKSQKVTILHYLTGTLTPYLNLQHLTKGHQTRSCWNKKEKIFTKTRWRPSFWNWKMNESYIVIWRPGKGNWEKSEKNHLFTIRNPYYHQQIFWHHQTIGENQRSVSVVSFFGPNVEPSSLLPRPKTATPVVPSSRKNSKNEKFVSDCDHYPLLFFSSSSLSHFFLKIITTFSFALLISRSVLFSSPPCFHASEMADRFSSSP